MNAPDTVPTSTVGEKMSPPLKRQLNTTSRARGRYQDMPPTSRVNCCRWGEPMYLELWAISTEPFEPLVGSMGLFTRGKVACAVKVASTRFCWSGPLTSGVQAPNTEQKLTCVASVRPYDNVYVRDNGLRRRGVVRVSATLTPVSCRR